ncbi:uncharacterized protein LOC133301690 [Gastrolobium bilobum]|uniref:uncharacterized protein LOC133301690 n=1 Tax=Gastrolobium bilobum TaxID=150636 RepID=UPI002AB13923|nr:uncharacterized protein LOC133301690 [Gastrolobium bilobum]
MRVQDLAEVVQALNQRFEESQSQISLMVAQMKQLNESVGSLHARPGNSPESHQEPFTQPVLSDTGNLQNPMGHREMGDPRSLLKFVKMEIPLFDGTNPDKWIFKTKLFFDLQRVPPELQVQLAGLRMEGQASSWFQWKYRSGTIRGWSEFTTALRQRFAVIPQKRVTGNLSKLSQTGTLKDYLFEFEKLMNQTQNLNEELLLSFFVSGLTPDLRRALEIHDPKSLQQAMELAVVYDSHYSGLRVSLNSGPKKSQFRSYSTNELHGGQSSNSTAPAVSGTASTSVNKASVGSSVPFKKLSNEEMSKKRELGLCYTCDEKWTSKHRCPSKMLIMVRDDTDEEGAEGEEIVWNSQPIPQEDAALHSLTEGSMSKAFNFVADIHGTKTTVLVDTGSTHNFVKKELALELELPMIRIKRMRVFLGNGEFLVCDHKCKAVKLQLQGEIFLVDLWVLNLANLGVILGMCWLEQLGTVTHDYKNMVMEFTWRSKEVRLSATKAHDFGETKNRRQAECWTMQEKPITGVVSEVSVDLMNLKASVDDSLWQLLLKYQSVFAIPNALPPVRNMDHAINVEQGSRPVHVRPYRYGHYQKEEIERQVTDLMASGFIKHSTSPYSSPVLLVKKQDGTWRMCVDYRALNKITIQDRFPMPTIDELMDELGGFFNVFEAGSEGRVPPNQDAAAGYS